MQLNKVSYGNLNSKQKEIYNFQKVAGLLADYGFNCIKLADDWQGADFLAYHKDGSDTLKVQLKSRVTIDKKYTNKAVFVAFPISESWYLIEHDVLVDLIGENTSWLTTESWLNDGNYSSAKPSKKLIAALEASMLE